AGFDAVRGHAARKALGFEGNHFVGPGFVAENEYRIVRTLLRALHQGLDQRWFHGHSPCWVGGARRLVGSHYASISEKSKGVAAVIEQRPARQIDADVMRSHGRARAGCLFARYAPLTS